MAKPKPQPKPTPPADLPPDPTGFVGGIGPDPDNDVALREEMAEARAAFEARQERREGRRYRSYLDSLGNPTIGKGHRIVGDELKHWPLNAAEDQLTDAQVDALYQDDLQRTGRALAAALPWMYEPAGSENLLLDPPRFYVLMDMAFNMGIGGLLTFVNFLACLKRGDYHMAAQELDTHHAAHWRSQIGDPRVDELQEIVDKPYVEETVEQRKARLRSMSEQEQKRAVAAEKRSKARSMYVRTKEE